ncbi:MAG: tetratricopeptide repeat protein [Taibaiella sp.]|nr:tetratricopeptide repeat protein [Taibaiella sp.]
MHVETLVSLSKYGISIRTFAAKTAWRLFALSLGLVALSSGYSFAGRKRVDSLRHVLLSPGTKDTTRVMCLAGMAWEYKNRNSIPDSVLYYANKGLELASTINFPKGIALCKLHIGMANILQNDFGAAFTNLNTALSYYESQPASRELNEAYHNMGLNYYMQTKFEPAIKYFHLSEDVADELGNDSRSARAAFYLGDIYNDRGNYADALKEYLKALKLYETTGNQSSASNCLTNIATVYAQLKDFEHAKEYIGMSLDKFSHSNNLQEIYQNFTNIGIVYSLMGEYDNALKLFDKGIALTDSTGDEYWKTVFLANKAEVYTSSGRAELAVAAYKEVLQRNQKEQDVNFEMSAHSGLGRILYNKGKKAEGIAHMQQGLELMQKTGLLRNAMETAHDLSDIFEKEGNYRKALEYQRLYDVYEDSIVNESSQKKIQQLQFDFELEKKQREIERLSKTREIQKERSDRQRIANWSLVAALVLLATIVVLMYRNALRNKKHRGELMKRKREIEQQAARLEQLNHFKDKTFSVLSHDLRGPINSITATMRMLNDNEISQEEYASLQPEINNQLSYLNMLLDNVLLWAKSYIQEEKLTQPANTNLSELVAKKVSRLKEAAERKKVTLKNEMAPNTMALCDEEQINIVLRNLVMNAIKYTRSGGTITISGGVMGNNVTISIADTGVGMTKAQLENLFSPKTGRSTYGTEGERGIGLGLLLCMEFVKINNGTVTATSEPGKGSTFTITLPKAK